jgi:hypothetical protein
MNRLKKWDLFESLGGKKKYEPPKKQGKNSSAMPNIFNNEIKKFRIKKP